MLTKTCRWVKASKEYCDKPTKYHMEPDDNDNMVRRYATFCKEHQKLADAQENNEEDELLN